MVLINLKKSQISLDIGFFCHSRCMHITVTHLKSKHSELIYNATAHSPCILQKRCDILDEYLESDGIFTAVTTIPLQHLACAQWIN